MIAIGVKSCLSAGLYAILFLMAAVGRAQPPPLAFHHVAVVNVRSGSIDSNRTVLIRGSRIVAVGSSSEVRIPESAVVFDATGKYLIPGLWDMHVHITDATELALPVLLANGVTGVRDCGGDFSLLKRMEQERSSRVRVAPRLVISGPYVDSDKGLPHRLIVESESDGRNAVDSLALLGVDFIKIHNGVPRDAYFALLNQARKQGLSVAGHIPLEVAPWEAARARQPCVEHFASLFEGSLQRMFAADPVRLLSEYVDSGLDTLMALFAKEQVWFTPTVYTYWIRAKRGELAADPDPRLRYVAPSLKEQWEAWYPVTQKDSIQQIVAARELFYQIGLDVVRSAHKAGVPLLAGTDLAARDMLPGFHLHDELAAFVEAGLTPLDALRAATWNPARFLHRLNDLGSVEEGKLADLILLDANPLEDIHNTRRIRAVVMDGRLFDRDALDRMLAEAESGAQR